MIRARQKRIAVVLGLAAAADFAGIWACQGDLERPPRAGCGPGQCPTLGPISGGGAGPQPDTGVVDALSDVPADATVELTGVVRLFSNDAFQNTVAFQRTAEIRAQGPAGNDLAATYDGQNPFVLAGVPFNRGVWLTALPAASPDEAMTTITLVDTTVTDPVTIALIPGEILDSVYNVVTNPIIRAMDKGQVVLRFVNDSPTPGPLAGVRANLAGAEARIYDTGGGFSDVEFETGPLGLALFANVDAVALPGAEQSVRIDGLVSTSLNVRIAANSATFVLVRLAP